jgi:hypothetical protein
MRALTFFALLALSLSLFGNPARATQVIPGGVEYTNDQIEEAGQLKGCIIVVAIVSPPSPESVNFEFLFVSGRAGFKISVGDIDWNAKSISKKTVVKGDFGSREFAYHDAFTGSVSPEGSYVAFLKNDNLTTRFMMGFISGRYSISFLRSDQKDVREYGIEQIPAPKTVIDSFKACIDSIAKQ